MKSVIYIAFFLVILKSCYSQNVNRADIEKMLKGKWISTQDSNEVTIFTNDTIKEYYKGIDGIDCNIYKVTSKPCDTLSSLKKEDYYYIERYDVEIKDTMCYSIAFINETCLELVYIAGGRVLFFKREQ